MIDKRSIIYVEFLGFHLTFSKSKLISEPLFTDLCVIVAIAAPERDVQTLLQFVKSSFIPKSIWNLIFSYLQVLH